MNNPRSLRIRAKKLGVLIKDARMAAGLSMKDCARAIGVTSSRIKSFENGDKPPSLPELENLAFFLNVPMAHFWGKESRFRSLEQRLSQTELSKVISLRTKIIGAILRQARTDVDMSLKDLSAQIGITPRMLKTYETGKKEIPLPELEAMADILNIHLEQFQDNTGEVGEWARQQERIQRFLDLPQEIQDFVVKPVNLPYVEIANRLSGLSVERLRAMAEGLLDITL
jgi:transcriptional regulator with XRE-family HTH domain